jgi:hypothetical protein
MSLGSYSKETKLVLLLASSWLVAKSFNSVSCSTESAKPSLDFWFGTTDSNLVFFLASFFQPYLVLTSNTILLSRLAVSKPSWIVISLLMVAKLS